MVGASALRRAARKIGLPCGSFSRGQGNDDPILTHTHNIRNSGSPAPKGRKASPIAEEAESGCLTKSLCAICLEPLICNSPGPALFTAQCSHSFHFTCISSNVRHGSVTCPICRAHWTQLPLPRPHLNPTDPILRILDDSIATLRVHRRSARHRYDDDDPLDDPLLHHNTNPDHRLHFALVPHFQYHPRAALLPHQYSYSTSSSVNASSPPTHKRPSRACLSVKVAQQAATDLVLVASPSGPHLRLLKQSMALVVFSLRSVDRLAIVTYSSTATRAFPLRRMTCQGKRTALQVIDRLFYSGEAHPAAGLNKGIKILEDRTHRNPQSSVLHLSHNIDQQPDITSAAVPIHEFNVFNGLDVMHEFEEFLARLVGGVIRDAQLKIGEEGETVRLGELRGGEERRIPLDVGGSDFIYVSYSYVEEECLSRAGEAVVSLVDDNKNGIDGRDAMMRTGGRTSNVESSWNYHDPYMARRWAKHLHGYRL